MIYNRNLDVLLCYREDALKFPGDLYTIKCTDLSVIDEVPVGKEQVIEMVLTHDCKKLLMSYHNDIVTIEPVAKYIKN